MAIAAPCKFECFPREIIEEIFLSWMDDIDTESPITDALPLSKYPMIFTGVCKLWTKVALSLPHLWSTITIPLCMCRRNERTPPLPVIQRWIERSGASPLSFAIRVCRKEREYEPERYNDDTLRLLAVFIPHHLRWCRVALQLGRIGMVAKLLVLQSDKTYPLLEKISVSASSTEWGSETCMMGYTTGLRYLLSHSPLLAEVDVGQSMQDFWKKKLLSSIPMGQLTHLRLSPGKTADSWIMAMLKSSLPRLKYLSIDVSLSLGYTKEMVRHEALEELILLPGSYYPMFFVAYLSLPNLRSLSVFVEDYSIPGSLDILASFIRRSGCPLTKFSCQSEASTPTILPYIQRVSASVQELHLDTAEMDTCLQALTVGQSPSDTALCPQLQKICLNLRPSVYTTHGSLSTMVESRWNPPNDGPKVARLQEVDIRFTQYTRNAVGPTHWPRPLPVEDVNRLRELGRDGSARRVRMASDIGEFNSGYVDIS